MHNDGLHTDASSFCAPQKAKNKNKKNKTRINQFVNVKTSQMSRAYNGVEHDEWTTVFRKAKPKANKSNSRKSESKPVNVNQHVHDRNRKKNSSAEHVNTTMSHQYGVCEIKSQMLSLRSSSFFTSVKDELKQLSGKFDSVVGLGIGSFTTSPSSLLQFCLLLLMSELLVNSGEATTESKALQIFDPTMTIMDSNICTELYVTVNKENKMGKYDGTGRTLFFMPHCPYRLYCNLLWQNWNQLSDVVILGNSFQSYTDRRLSSSDVSDTLQLLSPCVEERRVWRAGNTFVRDARQSPLLAYLENAFCDLSLMRFPGPDGVEGNKWLRLKDILSRGRVSEADIDAASLLDVELF